MQNINSWRPPNLSGLLKRWCIGFWAYVRLSNTSGFIPRTFLPMQLFARFVARTWVFVQVGHIKVINEERLRHEGPVIFTPNHSSMFDAFVMNIIIKRWARYMTAVEMMRPLNGLQGLVLGAVGSFAVDRINGSTVLDPAINVVARGHDMVIFPEGKISPSGQMLRFKSGAARIAQGAARQSGRRVTLMPVRICFGKRDFETANIDNYLRMGLKWRGGVTVTILPPVYVYPDDGSVDDQVTALVRQSIADCLCQSIGQ